jgi:Domain of unknown function (DUF4421)
VSFGAPAQAAVVLGTLVLSVGAGGPAKAAASDPNAEQGDLKGTAPSPGDQTPVPPSTATTDSPRFLVRPFIAVPWLALSLSKPGAPDIDYSPNTEAALGLTAGYRSLNVSFSFNIPGSEEDAASYGKTTYFDFQIATTFHGLGHEWLLSGFVQAYQGFYVDDNGFTAAGGGHVLYPNLDMATVGVALDFFSNRDFSYDAAFLSYKQRAHSAGSWALRAAVGFVGFRNTDNTSIIPVQAASAYGSLADLNAVVDWYTSLSGGYVYDWLITHRLFLSGGLLVGATIARQTYELSTVPTTSASVGASATLTAALGYVGPTFHGGLAVDSLVESSSVSDASILFLRGAATLFFGARF